MASPSEKTAKKRRWLSWIVPQSLAAQLTLLLLVALFLSHAIVTALMLDDRALQAEEANRRMIAIRTLSILELIATIPIELHPTVIQAASDARVRFQLSGQPSVETPTNNRFSRRLAAAISRDLGEQREVRLSILSRDAYLRTFERRSRQNAERRQRRFQEGSQSPQRWNAERQGRPFRPDGRRRTPPPLPAEATGALVAMSVEANNGQWLNVTAALAPPARWAWPLLLSIGLMGLMIIVIVIWMVSRIVRPLSALSKAAEGLGRGERVAPLPEKGPRELVQTTRAFNDMEARLTRFIADRTRLLAAVGHDLRTPITSLRLRAEFIDDEENRERIVATLDEMAAMVESTLSFARDDAATELSDHIDLAASLQSLSDEYKELGKEVDYQGPSTLSVRCKPLALRRAVRNLTENALRYGGAHPVILALQETADGPQIDVRDQGPGIPPHQLDEVFEPFVRLETSRNTETGGVGLGLSIARSVARALGGDLNLINRTNTGGQIEGLTARLSLAPSRSSGP